MYKKGLIFFVAFLLQFTYFNAYSQDEEKTQAVFLEIGGSGIAYSINYDTRFTSRANGWGGRIGFGYFVSSNIPFTNSVSLISIPVGINYLLGEKKNFLDMGAGVTFYSAEVKTTSSNTILYNLAIGYRRVSDSGFTFRAGFTPSFGNNVFRLMPQISLGYSF